MRLSPGQKLLIEVICYNSISMAHNFKFLGENGYFATLLLRLIHGLSLQVPDAAKHFNLVAKTVAVQVNMLSAVESLGSLAHAI